MPLTPIVTDGTETGSTSAAKINAAFTQIDTNTTNIETLTTGVSTNTTNITTNATDIGDLDTRVTTNETDIGDLDTRVTTNTTNIATNVTNIGLNTTAIGDLDTRVTTNETNITTNTTDIGGLDTRVTTNETNITDVDTRLATLELNTDTAIAVRGINPTLQPLVADTPTKLTWMTAPVVDSGYSALSFNIGTNEFYIHETAIYKVFGTITFVAPNNDNVTLTLYNNGIPTNFQAYAVGKGNTKRVSVAWTAMETLTAGDTLSIYVESDGIEINVTYGNLVMERTSY